MPYKDITMYTNKSILCKKFIIDLINFYPILQSDSKIMILSLSTNYYYYYDRLLDDIQNEILTNYFFNCQTTFYICFEKKHNETRFIILPTKSSFPDDYLAFEKTKIQLFNISLQQTKIIKKISFVASQLALYDKYNEEEKQKNFLKFLKITKDIPYYSDSIICNNLLETYLIYRNIKFNFFKKQFFEAVCKEINKQFRIIFNDNTIQLSVMYKPAYNTEPLNFYENNQSLSQILTYYFK